MSLLKTWIKGVVYTRVKYHMTGQKHHPQALQLTVSKNDFFCCTDNK